MASSRQASSVFPQLKIPPGKEPWQLGQKENWGELGTALEPMEGFRVRSAAAEAHLAKSRETFDTSADPTYGRGFIQILVDLPGGDNDSLLEKLLALGLHPDLECNEIGWYYRPSHVCGSCARPKCAKAISLCRPNLHARNKNDDTPLEAARVSYTDGDSNFPETERAKVRPQVARVWEDAEKKGFPSIAEMACNKQWFAVQNLCRRRVVAAFSEGLYRFQGRTAVEWAVHYGEKSLAEELRYFLERFPSDMAVAALHEGAQQTASQIAAIEKKLDASTWQLQQEVRKEADKLKVAQDASSNKVRETMNAQLQALQKETKDHQDEVYHNIVEIQSRLVCNRQIFEEGQESLASQVDTLKKEFMQLLNESREKHEEEIRTMHKEMQVELAQKDNELRKLRRTLEKMAERQKDLEDDVEDLEETLDKIQTKKPSTSQPTRRTDDERRDEWK